MRKDFSRQSIRTKTPFAKRPKTLNETFRNKIEKMREEERIGTMLFYRDILTGIEKYAGNSIGLKEISVEWLNDLERHLLKRVSYTTVAMYMRGIRAMMNEARRAGTLKEAQYPFGIGKYEIRSTKGKKKALSLEEISLIANYTDGNSRTEFYRDIWLFLYMSNGMNMADLVRLKYKNIVDGEICFYRQKTIRTSNTMRQIYVSIMPEMEKIISKWGNERSPDNLIFPLVAETDDPIEYKKRIKNATRCVNNRLRLIGRAVGIEKITTYTARHSYATILERSGVTLSYISESLGHSSIKTTENYLASFKQDERRKNAALLTNFRLTANQ